MTKSIEVSDHQYSVLASKKQAGGRTASTRNLMRCRAGHCLWARLVVARGNLRH